MGVSLGYITIESVSPEVKSTVRAEAESFERNWIGESILFYDKPSSESPIMGDTKLFTADPADCDAAGADAQFIIERLCEWSNRFSLAWTLEIAGVELGPIEAGQADPKIFSTAQALISMGDMDFSDAESFA
jgi:hypothetical protein